MSDPHKIQTGHVSWSPDYDSSKPPVKLSGLAAPPCSLPKYLKTCRPPFFRVGEQIFGKCKDGDAIALDIRGRGRLTNASSKITEDEACAMQDEFGDWVCKTLNAVVAEQL